MLHPRWKQDRVPQILTPQIPLAAQVGCRAQAVYPSASQNSEVMMLSLPTRPLMSQALG